MKKHFTRIIMTTRNVLSVLKLFSPPICQKLDGAGDILVVHLDHVASMAPLNGVGLSLGVSEGSEHVARRLAVGDDCLLPVSPLVQPAVRLQPVGEGELRAEDVDVLLAGQQLRPDGDGGAVGAAGVVSSSRAVVL